MPALVRRRHCEAEGSENLKIENQRGGRPGHSGALGCLRTPQERSGLVRLNLGAVWGPWERKLQSGWGGTASPSERSLPKAVMGRDRWSLIIHLCVSRALGARELGM